MPLPPPPPAPTKFLQRVEIWTDVECNGGTRLSIIPRDHLIEAIEYLEVSGDEELRIRFDPASPAWPDIDHSVVLRPFYQSGDWDEYRVTQIRRGRDSGIVLYCTAKGIKYDLKTNARLVQFDQSNGKALLHHELINLTPEQTIDALINTGHLPSHFTKGTIEPDDLFDPIMDWETWLSVLEELATITTTELHVERNGTTDYKIHLLEEMNDTVDPPLILFGKNQLSAFVVEDSEEMGTWIYPKGEGPQGAAPTIGEMEWIIIGKPAEPDPTDIWRLFPWTGDVTVPNFHPSIHEDDQLNGFYVQVVSDPTGRYLETYEILDCWRLAPPNDHMIEIQLDTSILSSGFEGLIVSIREGGTGGGATDTDAAELVYLPKPSTAAPPPSGYGVHPLVLERQDIPGITNRVSDPFGNALSSSRVAIGAPTVTPTAGPHPNNHYGDGVMKIEADTGEGVYWKVSQFRLNLNPNRPHVTVQAWMYLEAGEVQMDLYDVTNDQAYPFGTDDDGEPRVLVAFAENAWHHLAIAPANFDFYELGTTEIQIRFTAVVDSTVFWVDAVQTVTEPTAGDKIVTGASAGQLWAAAIRAFEDGVGDPKVTLDASVLDLERLDVTTYPFDVIDRGVTAIFRDPGVGIDITQRIFSVERDLLREALTRIELVDK